jgi:hypothetical protein
VRVLGCFLLVDQGELDWKVITMQVEQAERSGVYSGIVLLDILGEFLGFGLGFLVWGFLFGWVFIFLSFILWGLCL